jgi:hypothetical protein
MVSHLRWEGLNPDRWTAAARVEVTTNRSDSPDGAGVRATFFIVGCGRASSTARRARAKPAARLPSTRVRNWHLTRRVRRAGGRGATFARRIDQQRSLWRSRRREGLIVREHGAAVDGRRRVIHWTSSTTHDDADYLESRRQVDRRQVADGMGLWRMSSTRRVPVGRRGRKRQGRPAVFTLHPGNRFRPAAYPPSLRSALAHYSD